MLFETTAEYVVLAVCVLGSLTLLGLPVRVALMALARTSMPVPTPLLGMSFAVVLGWYGYRFAGGVVPLFRIAGIVGALVALAWVVLHRAELGGVVKAGSKRLAVPLSIAMGVGLVMMVGLGSVLSLSYPTVVSNPNNDIAAYALIGQHVADGEPGQEGSIAGYDAGLRSQSWDFGPLAILAASSSMGPSADVWRYQLPLLGVAVGLIAYMLAIYFRELLPGRTLLTTLAAISSVCGFLFTLVWSFYFLNQLLATGLVLGLTLLMARGAEQRSLRARVAFAIAGGVVLCGLIASYPHMAALGPAVLLPALFFARSVHGTIRRGVALVVQAIGVGLVALLLLPDPITRLPEAIREIATAEAGFSLPGFLPMEILGDLSTAAPVHGSPWEWAPSVVVLLALAASCVYLIRRQHTPNSVASPSWCSR